MRDLSIIIPARCEMFLRPTVESVLANIEADTEIIVILDGAWADPGLDDHPRVTIIYHPEPVGQRAATNEGARVSRAKYICKLDAHCAIDKGFDVKMMAEMQPDWTMVPRMFNLHVFDWRCTACDNQTYQGPRPEKCEKCGVVGEHNFERKLIFQPRWSRRSDYMRFDHTLHFQYWGSLEKRDGRKAKEIDDQMACVGACWMLERERYWKLGGMDERHGSWGQMGVELGCKSWLSGGRQVVNKKTWFSHLFRTQPGFGFPYKNPGIDKARDHSRWLWFGDNWEGAKYKLEWLIKQFAPIPDWEDFEMPEAARGEFSQHYKPRAYAIAPEIFKRAVESPGHLNLREAIIPITRVGDQLAIRPQSTELGLVYYTDSRLDAKIADPVRNRLRAIAAVKSYPIVCVSLKPVPNFGSNIVLNRSRGILTMFMQIYEGLAALNTKYACLVEHDVMYHPTHFDFQPPKEDAYFYNEHTYKVDTNTGQAVFYYTKQTSGLCANRELLVGHYERRIGKVNQNAKDLTARGEPVKRDGFSQHMGFEPGCHQIPRGVDNYRAERWMCEIPNVDIRHNQNLTPTRWDPSQFRSQNACKGWSLVDEIPGWGTTKDRFWDFLKEQDDWSLNPEISSILLKEMAKSP